MQRVISITLLSLLLASPAVGADDFVYKGDSYSRVVADFKKLSNEYKTSDMDPREFDDKLFDLASRANKLVEADSLTDPRALTEDGYIYHKPYNCAPKETCEIVDHLERLYNIITTPNLFDMERFAP